MGKNFLGQKKKKIPGKKKFFFALKSFLNDFKAILRVIFFCRIFWWWEICLRKKTEKISRQISPPSKNPKFFFALKTALKSFKNDFKAEKKFFPRFFFLRKIDVSIYYSHWRNFYFFRVKNRL